MLQPPPIFQSRTPSPLGDVLLATIDQSLIGVWFVQGQAHMPDTQHWIDHDAHPTLQAAAHQLHEYFNGQRQTFDVPLQAAWGTAFQRAVWQGLQRIPYGRTVSYGQLARDMKNPQAVRAVGAAIGQNPHSILVPCHRVLGANGALTGFAGGLERKKYLLAHETRHT